MTSVLVVDDQALIRQAVRLLVDGEPDLHVVGEAADGAAAVAQARRLRPDVVLMDIRMPGTDGIAGTSSICADPDLAGVRVLVLTTFEDDGTVLAALRAGASGFMGKGADPADLIRAVRTVAAGEELLSPAATRALIRRTVGSGTASASVPEGLTAREGEILGLVGRGLTNQAIADRLVISPHTAKTHVNRIMAKLGAHDRAQLVVAAYESGLAAPGPG